MKINITEIVNEGLLMIVSAILFVFTDLVEDMATKEKTGWIIIYLVLGVLLINLIAIVSEYVLVCVKKCRYLKKRKRDKRNSITTDTTFTGANLFSRNDISKVENKSKNVDDIVIEEFQLDRSIVNIKKTKKPI